MDRLCEELDEAKAEIEKLRADLQRKTELSENLRKACNDQLIKFNEATTTIERQAHKLNERSEEISEVKQTCDDLRNSLNERESLIRHLTSANDKLRVDCDGKYLKWEEEKGGLVLALNEANGKNVDQEQKIQMLKAEIEGLEGLLSAARKKSEEVEIKAKACRELGESEEAWLKLEEQNRKVEDQLKWKKEQFKHLEDAHEMLRNQYRESKEEWQLERSTLIDEIGSLRASLDSQARISEDLQKRLQMCNEALAHEESRRKYLEIEVSEFRSRFEIAITECEDTKSKLECLTTQRDKEIAALRHSMGTKESLYKEVEHRAGKLELENQELLASIKELQEAQIQEVGSSSSLAKLRSKLKSVEQMRIKCSASFRAKEAKWSAQIENLTREVNSSRSALECREADLENLKLELEDCHSIIMQLKLRNVEESVISMVLKSGIAEAELSLRNAEDDMRLGEREREEYISLLMKELEMKTSALAKVSADAEECQKAAALVDRVAYLEPVEEEHLVVLKELERYKEMLEEASTRQLCFKKQAVDRETDLNNKIRALCDALDSANAELALEQEKALLLARRIESFDEIEKNRLAMLKELERYKEMIDESSRHRVFLEGQIVQNESVSRKKLKEVNELLDLANSELAEYREKAAFLSDKVESLVHLEKQQFLMQEELRSCKKMLEESSMNQKLLEEKASNMEADWREKLGEVCHLLDTSKSELAKEREKIASLSRRLESFDLLEKEQLAMMKEIESYKAMLEELSRCRLRFKEQALQKENSYKQKLQEACDALEKANADLASKICEGYAAEFESWIWRSIAEHLKGELQENHALRKELEASLIAQIEARETIREEKQAEIILVHKACEKIAAAEILMQLEIEEKKLIIQELEDDIYSITWKLESSLSHLKEQSQVGADLEAKQLELKELVVLMERKLRDSEALVDELKTENGKLVQDVNKLSTERGSLLDFLGAISDWMSQFSIEDMHLMECLERAVKSMDSDGSSMVHEAECEFLDSTKENVNALLSSTTKKFQAVLEERSPLTELNQQQPEKRKTFSS